MLAGLARVVAAYFRPPPPRVGLVAESAAHVVRHASIPRQSVSPELLTFVCVLPAVWGRQAEAISKLEGVLARWGLPVALSRRLIVPASHTFEVPGLLHMYAEWLDALLTIELWADDQRLYGIDCWLGTTGFAEPAEEERAF